MRWAPLKIKATMQTKANLDKIALYLGLPVFFNVARWNKIRGVLVLFITYSHVAFPNCKLFYLCSQILRFLRIDRKATAQGDVLQSLASAFSWKISVLHFKANGSLSLCKSFRRELKLPFEHNPQWFLNKTTDRTKIPSSRHLLNMQSKIRSTCTSPA